MDRFLAGYQTEGTHTPDLLVAGDRIIRTKKVVIPVGQVLARGALLGMLLGAVGTGANAPAAAAIAGNTGNGVLTLANPATSASAKAGVYRVTMIEPAANGGTFVVEDPDGVEIGRGAVGAAFDGPVKFTVADGATDFVAGDGFTVAIRRDAATQALLSLAAATDGSQEPACILVHPVDSTAGAIETMAYINGDFNEDAVIYGAGHTKQSVGQGLRSKGLFLVHVIP